MASVTLLPYQTVTVSVPASSAIATFATQPYTLATQVVSANYPPPPPSVIFGASGANTTSAFTNATNVIISNGGAPLLYQVGTGPVLWDRPNVQGTPGTLDATGTLTAALILTGIVTSTTAAAVTGTTDTAALIDAATSFAVGESYDFSVINTGGTNAFTLAGGTGVTVVGTATVAANTSARFRLRKTAATPTFTIYRL